MKSHTFYVNLKKPTKPTIDAMAVTDWSVGERMILQAFAENVLNSQVITGNLIAILYEAFKDLEGVNNDATKDVIETRINRVHKNGVAALMAMIDVHNARSQLCTTIIKETS